MILFYVGGRVSVNIQNPMNYRHTTLDMSRRWVSESLYVLVNAVTAVSDLACK